MASGNREKIRTATLLLLLPVILALSSCAGGTASELELSFEEANSIAENLQRMECYAEAVAQYRRIIDRYPAKGPEAGLKGVADTYYAAHDFKEAVLRYKELSEKYPRLRGYALSKMADCYENLCEWDNCCVTLRSLLGLESENELKESAKKRLEQLKPLSRLRTVLLEDFDEPLSSNWRISRKEEIGRMADTGVLRVAQRMNKPDNVLMPMHLSMDALQLKCDFRVDDMKWWAGNRFGLRAGVVTTGEGAGDGFDIYFSQGGSSDDSAKTLTISFTVYLDGKEVNDSTAYIGKNYEVGKWYEVTAEYIRPLGELFFVVREKETREVFYSTALHLPSDLKNGEYMIGFFASKSAGPVIETVVSVDNLELRSAAPLVKDEYNNKENKSDGK